MNTQKKTNAESVEYTSAGCCRLLAKLSASVSAKNQHVRKLIERRAKRMATAKSKIRKPKRKTNWYLNITDLIRKADERRIRERK